MLSVREAVELENLVTTEVFWVALATIVALAATVGSALAFAVTAWIRHRERPHADWAVTMNGYGYWKDQRHHPDGFHLTGRISNAGDGAAFRVRLEGRGCTASLSAPRTEGRVALLSPGDEAEFTISAPLGGWADADVDVVWMESPTRLQKESRVPLHPRMHMTEPEVTEVFTDPESGAVSRRLVTEFYERS